MKEKNIVYVVASLIFAFFVGMAQLRLKERYENVD